MGFFDDLKKAASAFINAADQAAKKAPQVQAPNSNELKNAAEKLRNTLGGLANNGQTSKPQSQQSAPSQPKPQQPQQPEVYDGGTFWDYEDNIPIDKKISDILAEKFSQYEVRRDVSPTEIGGTGKFMNYSFGIYQNGSPKLFIMLTGKTTNNCRLYRWSKEQAVKAGITMINFVPHFPNRPEYVAERLAKYL